MRKIKVGISQQVYTSDIQSNRKKNIDAIKCLALQGAQLIVLSELHDSLYFCQEENVKNFDLGKERKEFISDYCELAKEEGVVIVTSMFERRATGLYHNTSVVIDSYGKVAGTYRKMHIPDDPAYYEKFYFTPGDLGFHPIATSIGKLGVLICWDQWYPEAARIMALSGADILIYPTAIGWESTDSEDEKQRQLEAWITVQRGHAVANGLPVVTVNRTGLEADPSGKTNGILFWGNSFVCGPQGELLFRAPADKVVLKVIEIDFARCEQVRRWWPFLRDRRIDSYDGLLKRFID